MKRFILLTIFCILAVFLYAQSISVSSFKLLETDLTANTTGTMETDQNGETAALIKVVTTQTGFTFDGGALGIVKTVQKPSEVWVYVPRGLKKITISHPQLGMLRDYYLNIPIEAARTYEMVLESGVVQTIVKQVTKSQYLVIKVNPENAIVELNNEILPTEKGVAQKFLSFGTYDYRVQANNYHTSAGKITIDNSKEKKILEVKLNPAFGWLEILEKTDLNGASIYLDNTLIGIAPLKSGEIPSGKHSIKIAKNLYKSYEDVITILDNEITKIGPSLIADFSTITLTVDNDASIYVNDEFKGNGTWTGDLGSGIYMFEARKEGYKKTSMQYEITSSLSRQTIKLQQPTPVFGELNILSTPTMSNVFIDGKECGQTPIFIPEILIGEHQVVIKHDGFGDYSSSFIVEEGKTCEINAKLPNTVKIRISAKTNIDLPLDILNSFRKMGEEKEPSKKKKKK